MYRTRLMPGLAGLAALFVLPAVCFAKDYCVTSGGSTFVGKGFAIPTKGNCKSWIGFTFEFAGNSPSSGTGCTSSDGSTFNLTITTSEPENGGGAYIDSMTLALPDQTGTDHETALPDSNTINSFTATGAPCKGATVPAVVTATPADAEAGVDR
jgi:hypothetical protein